MATAPQTGYAKGAALWYDKGDGTGFWVVSSKDNNTDNFITTPSFIGSSWMPAVADSANIDLNNLSDVGKSKLVKRELFNGRTQITWTSIPAGTSGYVASKNLVIPNIPSWFNFGDNAFIELTLQISSNTQNPTNNAQSKAFVTTSDIEAQKFISNPTFANSTEVIAGQSVSTRHTFKLNVNKANPHFICYADNLGNGGLYHVYLDLVQAVAYQYPN